jgi:predicted protein tyrosine phosphatase
LASKKILSIIIVLSLILFVIYSLYRTRIIYTVIEGRIFRSGQLSENALKKMIIEKNIKSILNLRGEGDNLEWYMREKKITEEKHVKLYDVGISPNELPECCKLMDILDIVLTSERPLLIHCNRGVDRTGMVSALALAIEENPPLSELRKQFSFRYGVLPFSRSIGFHFFSLYEQWLNKTNKMHSKDNLVYWIRNEYRDSSGNLKYWIDHANGQLFQNKKATISNSADRILIGGWAYDTCTVLPAENLHIAVDNSTYSKVNYLHNRPDVAKVLHLREESGNAFVIGWEAELPRNDISSGCHRLSLRIVKNDMTFDIPGENALCFE